LIFFLSFIKPAALYFLCIAALFRSRSLHPHTALTRVQTLHSTTLFLCFFASALVSFFFFKLFEAEQRSDKFRGKTEKAKGGCAYPSLYWGE